MHYDNGTTTQFTIPAAVTAQQIKWNWGTNYFALDRYSGVMNRMVDSRYFSTWDCQAVQKRAIE